MLKTLKAFTPSARQSKKVLDHDPVAIATKQFIKARSEEGLASLPTIIEACSSAATEALASQMTVLNLVTRYLDQGYAARQQRAIDLLRFLSDQSDNRMFSLMEQNHPVVKALDNILADKHKVNLHRLIMILLDHLCRKPNVPSPIVELHARHVRGISTGRPTIILSDQDAVADDILAATGESELLTELLSQSQSDESLIDEVQQRLVNTRARLVRSADTSTSDTQTVHIVETIEKLDTAMKRYYVVKGRGIERSGSLTSAPSIRSDSTKGKARLPRSNTEDELDNYGEGGSGTNSRRNSLHNLNGHARQLSSNNPFRQTNPFTDSSALSDDQFRSLKF